MRENKITLLPLTESKDNLKNPGRGFYQIHSFDLSQEIDFAELVWCVAKTDSIALLLVDIGAYRNRPIEETGLLRLQKLMRFFTDREMDLVLRCVYDTKGEGLLAEPMEYDLIRYHMNQLMDALKTCQVYPFIYQGMLLGSWGEMHNSNFLTPQFMKDLEKVLLAGLPKETYLAYRKPSQIRLLHGPKDKQKRIGLFDDGIFGSASHLGTFSFTKRQDSKWEESWIKKDEIDYLDTLASQAPCGGEVVYSKEYQYEDSRSLCEKQWKDLERLHITYLNRVYDEKLLEVWRSCKVEEEGIWKGLSWYDRIEAHLGYRFVIEEASLKTSGRNCTLLVTIRNTGFACLYQKAELILVSENAGVTKLYHSKSDLTELRSGEACQVRFTCPREVGIYSLHLIRTSDRRELAFANESANIMRIE